ncbi:MAG TPA: hypothetical protein VMT52_14325 [Planctomycetota bacterium]|nr:hypothetical protein [Planctomycetota bacterium]
MTPFSCTRSASTGIAALVFALLLLAQGPAGAQAIIKNGDVNGSGGINISDPLALLDYLFRGGPAPVEIVCPPAGDCTPVEPASAFEGQYYKSLDLDRAVEEEHGPLATLVSAGDHLYDWKARVGRELRSIDIRRAVTKQYGAAWSVVTTGVHRFDWKAFLFSEPDFVVLPVMLVASDRFFDIAGVAHGLNRYRSALGRVQGWYNSRVEGTLRFLQPIVLGTSLTSAQWNDLSALTAEEATRFALLEQCLEAYEGQLPKPGANLRVVISVYTGDSADVWLGAAATGRYAMAPPRATSLDCPAQGPLDSECADAAYAIGHELGHTFGLGHTCDDFPGHPGCSQSIMQTGRPPQAILLQREICVLLESPFFHQLTGGGAGAGDDAELMPAGLIQDQR